MGIRGWRLAKIAARWLLLPAVWRPETARAERRGAGIGLASQDGGSLRRLQMEEHHFAK